MIDSKDIRHEIHNILFTVKTANEEIKNNVPDLNLVKENLKSAMAKLEKLSLELGQQSIGEAQ